MAINFGQPKHVEDAADGRESARRSTLELDPLLSWIARDKTSDVAGERELRSRRPNEDSSRQRVHVWLDLMRQLAGDWAKTLQNEIAAVLLRRAFVDR